MSFACSPATWPWMCAPAGPASEGTLRMPAARMTGVASRNANRAASSLSSPRHRPPAMVTPDRLIPASSARICVAPIKTASW
jgi:hypothetical protein